MRAQIKNQSGFAAIEVALVIIIVGLASGTGAYVYRANKKANQTLTQASTDAASSSPKVSNKIPVTAHTPSTPISSTFKIPELEIQINNVPASLHDLVYNEYASDTGFSAVQFSTGQLTKADPACSAKSGSGIGALSKYQGMYDPVKDGELEDTAFVAQFSGYWIAYSHPESSCSNLAGVETLHSAQTKEFQALATKPFNIKAL